MNRPLDMDVNMMFPGMAMGGMGGPAAIMPAPGQFNSQFMSAPSGMQQQPLMGGMMQPGMQINNNFGFR